MITTLFFIQLIAFRLWQLTSRQIKPAATTPFFLYQGKNSKKYRLAGSLLLLATILVFVMKLGWLSGLSAALIGLMGISSLVITLHPFGYLHRYLLFFLYLFFLILELFI